MNTADSNPSVCSGALLSWADSKRSMQSPVCPQCVSTASVQFHLVIHLFLCYIHLVGTECLSLKIGSKTFIQPLEVKVVTMGTIDNNKDLF